MTRTFRAWTVATEAVRNLWSNAFFTGVIALSGVFVGFAVPAVTLWEVSSIRTDAESEVRAGANVLRVTGEDGALLPAGRCEALNSVPGILAAGGLAVRTTVFPAARPSDVVTLIVGTPTLGQVLWPSLSSQLATSSVVVGSATAETYGLTSGSTFGYEVRGDMTPLTAVVDRSGAPSTREPQLDTSVLIATAPTGRVRECLVEALPGARTVVEGMLRGWFGATDGTTVSPFYLPVTSSASPDERLTVRTTQYVPAIAALVLVTGMVAAWFSRRAEYSLYRMLGLNRRGSLLMHTVEMTVAVMVPVSVGMVAAMVVMEAHESLDVILATTDALRMLALLIPAPLLGWLLMRPATRADALHGR
ncbi:hypothetical protein JOF42_000356 [Microbacterium phyllosphaerae]|uniref:ABC transporter permease n=1 Tax=Microbacterium phyllosphaerae TaxID=124798 RepID=A0ABS4WKZ1_9MICO|nr:hypothetical protein [Microbacterium phyllosphaerae]MBP2376861.1 hypothetical protein [Microbacterium phyllosphaerae]